MAWALLQVRMLVRGDCPVEDLVLTPCTAFQNFDIHTQVLGGPEKAKKSYFRSIEVVLFLH